MNRRHSRRDIYRQRLRPLIAILSALAMMVAGAAGLTSVASAELSPELVIDNFNDGDASDWTFFGGNAAGGGGGALDDRPQEGSHYLSTGWGGNGSDSGFYGGAFRNLDNSAQVALPIDPWFNVWVLNQSDATVDAYTLEITIREDLDGNGWTDGAEDSFRLDTQFPAAAFDDQWALVSAPVSSFANLGTGGDGTFDGNLDEIVIVVAGVQGATGTTVEVDFDEFGFSSGPVSPGPGPETGDLQIIDDFQADLAAGVDGSVNVGFHTFQGAGSLVAISTETTPPAPVLDGAGDGNQVLRADLDVTSFAGFIHSFTNPTADAWVSQNWSTREGMSFWMYGNNSGTELFIDVLDNRGPDSTVDDAERWTVTFSDDFSGWKQFNFPFSTFTRKEIGNGAPNDGFTLFDVHGWAFGTLGTGGPQTYYFDDVALYGVAEPPAVAVQLAQQVTIINEGTTGEVAVKLNRPLGPDDPEVVSIDYATERSAATPGQEFTPTSGTLTFTRGGPSELSFTVETFDDSKFEGNEQVVVRLTNPVGVERGALFQGSVMVEDNDPFDSHLLDDFEQGSYLWSADSTVDLGVVESSADSPDARPGQDPVENVAVARVPTGVNIRVLGRVCWGHRLRLRPVMVFGSPSFDPTTIDLSTVRFGGAKELHYREGSGYRRGRHFRDFNRDGFVDAVLHFKLRGPGNGCGTPIPSLEGMTTAGQFFTSGGTDAAIWRDFPIGQDWTDTETIDFWYKGAGGGHDVVVTVKDNQAVDPGPTGWELVWSDEFNTAAGTPPDPAHWSHEIGDTTPDAKNGWGNDELQYYTDSPANAATDGNGNLVITLTEADGSQECYYGPCEFESARLLTQNKAEFTYGRVESRQMVPDGGAGLWPAFWSLGTDITHNPWPLSGEIDIMEYVSRLPNEAFGTIHGPGYAGGASFGGIHDFGVPVYQAGDDGGYHTFAVEWEPEVIRWYVDGSLYHQATPADVAPNDWVFDKPFFLLLNFAIGGNFGGTPDQANTYPQEFAVDYVRVYQAPDSAERFEATFVDDSQDWRRVSIPLSEFVRSAEQPAGAPDDGFNLNQVSGYGLAFPQGNATGEVQFDLVERVKAPAPEAISVTTLAPSGPGSLRQAMVDIADQGTISFDPSLAGGTIDLGGGQLVAARSVTIDGSDSPGLILSGSTTSRVLEVGPGATVGLNDLVISDGAGAPQGGGILNFGSLTLTRVVVRDNVQGAAGPSDFSLGGGGIYNGDGAELNLVESTVADNTSTNHPGGGVYGFFNSTINIARSTISGNRSGDVAGGLRSLGDVNIDTSTFSGNVSTAWHGGAIFHTDGDLVAINSTFADNVAPDGTASGLLVATFGSPASATLTNNIIEGHGGAFACAIEGGGAATITSGGFNVISDGSCNPTGDDQGSTDALLGPLADNGGFTFTHAPTVGSPAIDAGDSGVCGPVDQRGADRPQGGGCDVGAVEAN